MFSGILSNISSEYSSRSCSRNSAKTSPMIFFLEVIFPKIQYSKNLQRLLQLLFNKVFWWFSRKMSENISKCSSAKLLMGIPQEVIGSSLKRPSVNMPRTYSVVNPGFPTTASPGDFFPKLIQKFLREFLHELPREFSQGLLCLLFQEHSVISLILSLIILP